MRAHRYQPGPYREFEVREPKPRWISAAPFRDRVVHHALCRVLEPVLDRSFIADTYACRRGKGTHAALDRAQAHLRRSRWVLTLDVSRYFPSIDHAILRQQLARHVKDADVLGLCGTILDGSPPPPPAPADSFPGDALFTPLERRRGLPIGNLTSQVWANLYLARLDHVVQERLGIGRYVRYMDDILVFHDDPARLRAVRAAVTDLLAALRLRPHPRKTHLVPTDRGVRFLGFQLHPGHRLLAFEGKVRALRRLRRQARDYAAFRCSRDEVRESWNAWVGHAGWGDTWRLRRTWLREVAFRRRCDLEVAMA